MRLARSAKQVRFRIVGRSRFTGQMLDLHIDAATAEEAVSKAQRLGLKDVDAKPIGIADHPDAPPRDPESRQGRWYGTRRRDRKE